MTPLRRLEDCVTVYGQHLLYPVQARDWNDGGALKEEEEEKRN